MKRGYLPGIVLLLTLFLSCTPEKLPRIVIETEAGNIEAVLDTVRAPLTARNFLQLADRGIFAGACFYRVVKPDNQPLNDIKIEVIQGGLLVDSLIERFPAIPHETTAQTGLRHRDGTLSMARSQPGSASTEFFICIGNQPQLDFGGHRNPDGQGFAAFGRVTAGMQVVRRIQQMPDSGQYLPAPVKILRIRSVRPAN